MNFKMKLSDLCNNSLQSKKLTTPLVLFIDGNDKIGKSTMINQLPKILRELFPDELKEENSIITFHQSKNEIVKENKFPQLVTEGKLLNYIPTTDEEIFAQANQVGLTYLYNQIVAFEEQYDTLKNAKIIIADRGPITSAVYALALAIKRSGKRTYDWQNTLESVYTIFNTMLQNTRLFQSTEINYAHIVLLPDNAEQLINIYEFHKDDETDESCNVYEDSLDLSLLIYNMFSMVGNLAGDTDPIHTIEFTVPKRTKPLQYSDYTIKIAHGIANIIKEKYLD